MCHSSGQHVPYFTICTVFMTYRMDGDHINLLLETFREFTSRGDHATLFLEARDGKQFGTLRVKIPDAGRTPTRRLGTSGRKKSPSTVRRNQDRLRRFLARKTSQDSLGSPSSSTCSTPTLKNGLTSSSQVTLDKPVKDVSSEELDKSIEKEALIENQEHNGDDQDAVKKVEQGTLSTETVFGEGWWHAIKDKEAWLKDFEKICDRVGKQFVLKHENDNVDNNGENDMDNDDDNIEDVKKWALMQKQPKNRV